MINAYKNVVMKYTGKKSFLIQGHDRKENIKLYLKEAGYDVAWIYLVECRDQCEICVTMVINC
jgi:hypothetical protein